MKCYRILFVLTCCFEFFSADAQRGGFLKAEGQRIVDGQGNNLVLRGIGLGGWMLQEGYMLRLYHEGQQYRIRQRIDSFLTKEQTAKFYELWRTNHTSKSDIDSLHAWGFNSVRLPMHYELYTLPSDQEKNKQNDTWLPTGFALTDSLVSWCRQNNMYVFLDLHAAPGGQGNDLNISDRDPSKPSLWQSEADKQKTIRLWRKLAERYVSDTTVGGYDILNEPNWGFEDSIKDRNGLNEQKNIPLRKLLQDITNAIREVDKNHIIIIEGNGWGNNYHGMLPTWDPNMVLSFHKYWNKNDIQSIQYILDYRSKYNVPVWVGETGENSNTWFTEAIRLFESNNIGWSWWPLKKMGLNNPLQIPSNTDYDSLVNYWHGNSSRPTNETAYRGLMELVKNTKCENNIMHRNVVDAMIRQPFNKTTIPFGQNRITPGKIIKAVNYDLGVNGSAYFDVDTANTGDGNEGNRGHYYRNDGVDIFEDSLQKGEYYVGQIENGEWLQYTIDVQIPGTYKLIFQVASPKSEGAVFITVDGNRVAGSPVISIPATGGYHDWRVVAIENISLTAGTHRLRVHAAHGGFNLKSIGFAKP